MRPVLLFLLATTFTCCHCWYWIELKGDPPKKTRKDHLDLHHPKKDNLEKPHHISKEKQHDCPSDIDVTHPHHDGHAHITPKPVVKPLPPKPHQKPIVIPLPPKPHQKPEVKPLPPKPHRKPEVKPLPPKPHQKPEVKPLPPKPHHPHHEAGKEHVVVVDVAVKKVPVVHVKESKVTIVKKLEGPAHKLETHLHGHVDVQTKKVAGKVTVEVLPRKPRSATSGQVKSTSIHKPAILPLLHRGTHEKDKLKPLVKPLPPKPHQKPEVKPLPPKPHQKPEVKPLPPKPHHPHPEAGKEHVVIVDVPVKKVPVIVKETKVTIVKKVEGSAHKPATHPHGHVDVQTKKVAGKVTVEILPRKPRSARIELVKPISIHKPVTLPLRHIETHKKDTLKPLVKPLFPKPHLSGKQHLAGIVDVTVKKVPVLHVKETKVTIVEKEKGAAHKPVTLPLLHDAKTKKDAGKLTVKILPRKPRSARIELVKPISIHKPVTLPLRHIETHKKDTLKPLVKPLFPKPHLSGKQHLAGIVDVTVKKVPVLHVKETKVTILEKVKGAAHKPVTLPLLHDIAKTKKDAGKLTVKILPRKPRSAIIGLVKPISIHKPVTLPLRHIETHKKDTLKPLVKPLFPKPHLSGKQHLAGIVDVTVKKVPVLHVKETKVTIVEKVKGAAHKPVTLPLLHDAKTKKDAGKQLVKALLRRPRFAETIVLKRPSTERGILPVVRKTSKESVVVVTKQHKKPSINVGILPVVLPNRKQTSHPTIAVIKKDYKRPKIEIGILPVVRHPRSVIFLKKTPTKVVEAKKAAAEALRVKLCLTPAKNSELELYKSLISSRYIYNALLNDCVPLKSNLRKSRPTSFPSKEKCLATCVRRR